jgi:hypothetical protein
MSARNVWTTLAVLGVLALAGCDSGPKGRGVLPATVVAPQALGAVVLEFTGPGILGFEAQGTTQVYAAPSPSGGDKRRVIVVSPAGGKEIRFGIELADRAGAMPSVAAISAASPTNAAMVASGLQVRIER